MGFVEVSELEEKTYRLAQFGNGINNCFAIFNARVSEGKAKSNVDASASVDCYENAGITKLES